MHGRQFLLDVRRDLALDELRRDPHRVFDRIRIRRSVRDEACAFHTQQRRAAIFSVIEALLKISEGTAREQCSDLASDRRGRIRWERGLENF